MLGDVALRRLALFISQGQYDITDSVDGATLRGKGDYRRGAWLFGTTCAVACHGFNGDQIPLSGGRTLTNIARSDP